MRKVLVFLLLSSPLTAQSVEGIAINALTHQPLPNVHVSMFVAWKGSVPQELYGAMSGPDGHFSITGMKAARYGYSAKRNGFFLPAGNTGFTLADGEHKTDFLIELTPEAVISGRVVDDFGDPVQGLFVRASTVTQPARPSVILQNMHSQTDDRGEFRIVGAPGKFYVSVSMPMTDPGPREIRTDGTEAAIYGETWFPDSDRKDKATAVEAFAGRETTGIDIHLVRKRNLTISGVVTGTPAGSVRAQIVLNTKYYNRFLTPNKAGQFSFSGLVPDHYRLIARYEAAQPWLISQPEDIDLETADATGISLNLVSGQEVSGTLEVSGGADNHTVHLQAVVPTEYIETKGGETNHEGAFHIAPVYPGKYRVRVEPMPENAYLKSDEVIEFSAGGQQPKLQIVVGLNGAQIEGMVTSPVLGATISLAQKPDDIVGARTKYVEAGKKYKFIGIRPGKYRLVVIPTNGLDSSDLPAHFDKAPEIEVHEGDRIIKDMVSAAP